MSSQQPYAYDLLAVAGLDHLPTPTSLTVSRMRGGSIPADRRQYYVNTTYRIPDGSVGGGLRRTTGFSVQRQDIPKVVELLKALYEGGGDREPLFACERCSSSENGIVHHARREGCNNSGGSNNGGSGGGGQPQPADDAKAGDDEPSGGFIL